MKRGQKSAEFLLLLLVTHAREAMIASASGGANISDHLHVPPPARPKHRFPERGMKVRIIAAVSRTPPNHSPSRRPLSLGSTFARVANRCN
jgi:hypothetical protein